MLLIDQLSVELAGIQVLRRIHAHVLTGTTVALIGRNGAGKTTLLRSIMGLVPAKSGQLLFDQTELLHTPAHQRTSLGIGYAPEDRVIFPTLSVLDNLRLPAEVLGLSAAEIQSRLDAALEVIPQLEPMLARSGAALSGGQGKMVALGRALITGTRMVLLDEPLQGLAPVLAEQYVQAIGRLRQLRPALSVIITESNASLLRGMPAQTWLLERGSLSLDASLTS
ncbi:MAG: ATP-binding cassette domain-containing protein [Betaproteobacteria bacterium]|jgi:branched-chain amino acid transport system ATP-binding protein|nr:ATP-binding cassette domain-containing protein [Betaproteobacteria bacterium]